MEKHSYINNYQKNQKSCYLFLGVKISFKPCEKINIIIFLLTLSHTCFHIQ